MNDSSKFLLAAGGISALILGLSIAKGKTTAISTTGTSSTQSSTPPPSGVTIELGISPRTVISGNSVNISVVMTNGTGGSVVTINGLPGSLSIVTDASAIGSTTVIINKVGTYQVYATFGRVKSNTITLTVNNQCSNNSQCPSGQICQNGKCVTCPPQSCPCGSLWDKNSCSCATQTPGNIYFIASNGTQETSFNYSANFTIYVCSVCLLGGNVVSGAYLGLGDNSNCTGATCSGHTFKLNSEYTANGGGFSTSTIRGILVDKNNIPICNQTVQLAIANTGYQIVTDPSGGFQYASEVNLANSNGSTTSIINVKTDNNGIFTATLGIQTYLVGWNAANMGCPNPSNQISLLPTPVQINATFGNLPPASAIITETGFIKTCGLL